MKYTIGFKSGKKLEVDVTDGSKFVMDITTGVRENPSAPVQWYIEGGILIAVSEVEFIVPSSITKSD